MRHEAWKERDFRPVVSFVGYTEPEGESLKYNFLINYIECGRKAKEAKADDLPETNSS